MVFRISKFAGAALAVLTLAAGSAAANVSQPVRQDEGRDYAQDLSKQVPEDLRRTEPPDIFDAWQLRETLLAETPEAFGGLHGRGDTAELTILAVPGRRAEVERRVESFIAGRSSAPRVRLVEAGNTLRRLEDLRARMLEQREDLERTGTLVTSFGVDDASNRLVIGLQSNDGRSRSAVLSSLSADAGEVSFEQQDIVPPAVDRFTDVAPFNAGDRIWDENWLVAYPPPAGSCSSGFGVHAATTLVDYLLTAAHCSRIPGQAGFFWNGPNSNPRRTGMGFSTGVNFGTNQWDTQLIQAESSTITWTATANRSYITAAYIPVVNDGNRVINEGATSIPWQSGSMTVNGVNFCQVIGPYEVWGNVNICHLWRAVPPTGNCATQGGDSGGPIVSYSGYGPLAIGQVVAGTCSSVYFHSVGDMINRNPHAVPNGIHVNTTSDPG